MSYQIHVVKEAAKGHWREIFGFFHTGRKPGLVFAIPAELITTVLHCCNGLRAGHSMRR